METAPPCPSCQLVYCDKAKGSLRGCVISAPSFPLPLHPLSRFPHCRFMFSLPVHDPIFVAGYGPAGKGGCRLNDLIRETLWKSHVLLGQSVPPSFETPLVWHSMKTPRDSSSRDPQQPDVFSAPSTHLTCTQQPSGLNNHDNKP